MKNKIKISYNAFNDSVLALANKIKKSGKTYTSICPVPRGGYLASILLGKALGIEVLPNHFESNCLVVDDICDSGRTLEPYKGYDTAVVYVSGASIGLPTYYAHIKEANDWLVFPDEGETTIEDNIVRIFEYIGEDPTRVGLLGTPDRIKRMYEEIFRGYDPTKKPKITVFPNGEDGLVYDNMVIDEGNYYSMCEHHMMPFFGHYWFAYIPNPKGKILGISKIGRVVDYCAAKLQVQERLTKEIVDMLTEALGTENPPLGVALVMRGTHLCKSMRGVKKDGIMTSSYLIGSFREDSAVRSEFMKFVNSL